MKMNETDHEKTKLTAQDVGELGRAIMCFGCLNKATCQFECAYKTESDKIVYDWVRNKKR